MSKATLGIAAVGATILAVSCGGGAFSLNQNDGSAAGTGGADASTDSPNDHSVGGGHHDSGLDSKAGAAGDDGSPGGSGGLAGSANDGGVSDALDASGGSGGAGGGAAGCGGDPPLAFKNAGIISKSWYGAADGGTSDLSNPRVVAITNEAGPTNVGMVYQLSNGDLTNGVDFGWAKWDPINLVWLAGFPMNVASLSGPRSGPFGYSDTPGKWTLFFAAPNAPDAAHATYHRFWFTTGCDFTGTCTAPALSPLSPDNDNLNYTQQDAILSPRIWWSDGPSFQLVTFHKPLFDAGTQAPVPITMPSGCTMSTGDVAPWVTPDGNWMYFNAPPTTTTTGTCVAFDSTLQIYRMALRSDGQEATGMHADAVTGLGTLSAIGYSDVTPSFDFNTCTLYFASNRAGTGQTNYKLWAAQPN